MNTRPLAPRLDYAPDAKLRLEPGDPFARIVGTSAGLRQTIEKARLVAKVNAPLLLQGETGVGKEVFARSIHEAGRLNAPFVALNCGGLPRDLLASELFGYVDGAFTGARRSGMVGKFEAAQGGTVFLDEIAEMPLDLQPYLLRVLEEGEVCPLGSTKPRKVQFRLIAACNRDLRAEARAGRFRSDLLYRVSVMSLNIPALRERRDDIPALVHHFARSVAHRDGTPLKSFSPEVIEKLMSYPWPGNVRELRNVVESMVLLTQGEVVGASAVSDDLALKMREIEGSRASRSAASTTDAPHQGLQRLERDAIADSLYAHAGNLTQVARALRIARSTLYLKLKKYGLESILEELRSGGSAGAD